MRVEQLLVLGQATRARAHRVGVLAQHERHRPAAGIERGVLERRLLAAPDGGDVGMRGVHARPDVHDRARLIALVVERARAVPGPDLVGHRGEVAPDARLVAERPQDDARMVPVALDHPRDPVAQSGLPAGVVGRVVAPACLAEPVRLEVAFIDDPEAEPVGEVQQDGIGRIMRGPDRVDVAAPHERELRLDDVARDTCARRSGDARGG